LGDITTARTVAGHYDRALKPPGTRLRADEVTETCPPLSAATFDEHEGDMFAEHRFVNVLSSSCSS
jgi:hypothetical protein